MWLATQWTSLYAEKHMLTLQVRVGILVKDLGCYSGPRHQNLLFVRHVYRYRLLACPQVETPFRFPPKLITAGSVTEPTLPVTASLGSWELGRWSEPSLPLLIQPISRLS